MREPELANAVYAMTLQGLSNLVSERAAGRVLDLALRQSSTGSDTVSAEQMSGLLLGPILREFVSILPRQGLEVNLETLAATLLIHSATRSTPELAAPRAAPQFARRRNATVVTGVNTRPPARAHNSPARIDSALLAFARIDRVTLVAAIQPDGTLHSARGEGNTVALARFGMLALQMLERRGALHSYYLEHESGPLFLFPFNGDALLVTGTNELNIGTVFTTFSELTGIKEEP